MLRLTNPEVTHRVPIEVNGAVTIFHLKSMSIGMRMKWLAELQSTEITEGNAVETYPRTLELVSRLISSIEGYEKNPDGSHWTPLEVLELLERQEDLLEIMQGVIGFSSLSDTESKNSGSSSEQVVSESAGVASVGTIAGKDGERVFTIRAPLQPEDKE